jgi:hypothetical protein
VQASEYVRLRILATISERKKKYPNLWIHLLGLTPNQWLNAMPINSSDSSSWLNTVRWSGYRERASLQSVGYLPKKFQYELGDKKSWVMGWQMGAYGSYMNMLNWRSRLKFEN